MPFLSTYNGKPIIVLDPQIKAPLIPFSFGTAKAKVIMDRIFDIEKWYNSLPSGPNTDGKVTKLDITPENNNGKRFELTKYKAKLILQHKANIAEFIEHGEMAIQKEHDDARNKKTNMFLRGSRR